jgi:hypothetical protein
MAFGESWLISVMMRFTSNGARIMNELATQADVAAGKVDRITAAMTRLRNASTMVAGGIALIGAAIDVYGVSQAAKLELAMTGVYSATGASAKQRTQLFDMVTYISGVTAQSAVTIANEAFMAASSGLNNPDRLRAAFPQIAKAADVLWLSTKGTPKAVDPVNATMQMVKLSHLFGAYSGKPLHDMVDFATRLMMVQPDSLSKVVTQAKYFVPTAIAAGVDLHHIPTSDLAMALASMGQTGLLQGRGGTGLARYIEYMMKAPVMTAHLSKNARASMIDLGLFDAQGRNRFLDQHGNFELGASLHYLGEKFDQWSKAGERGRFIQDVFGAFLEQGGRFVSTMTLPQVRAQQEQNRIAMQRQAPPGKAVETLWDRYMHTTVGAWAYFVTNFQNLWIYTFTPMLPQVTAGLRSLGDAFGWIGKFMQDHPAVASGIAWTITWVTGLSALRFALGMLVKFAGIGAFFEAVKGLSGLAIAARALDEMLLAGVGSRILGLGLRIAGLGGNAATAASGVNALGTSIGALSGARAAAIGLTALGGAITVVTSAVAFWAGVAMEMNAAAKDPRRARIDAWGGGQQGALAPPPGAFPVEVDPGGHIITRYTGIPIKIDIHDKTGGGITSRVRSVGNIFSDPRTPSVLKLASPTLGLHP